MMTNDELVFVCLQCGHGCASYEDLTSHMEDHEDQKPDIRQLRKTTLFNKGKCGKKFARNSKKVRTDNDLKAEGGVQRTRMYSYPSYISIGNNNLDNVDTSWSQVNLAEKKNPNDTRSFPAKGTQKGSTRSKQMQAKQLPSRTVSGKQINQSKQTQRSRKTAVKPAFTKENNSKQPVSKHLSGKQTSAQKSSHAAIGSRARNIANSKKHLISAENKRKATGEPAIAAKNAKIKKKNNKKQATKSALLAQDIRRRSTNSMRLRKLTSAGEVCPDDSSESMSESERLAEAIRRSKLETKMTSSEAKNVETNGNFNRQEKGKPPRLLKGKQRLQNTSKLIEDKGRKGHRDIPRKLHDQFVGASQDHLVGRLKSSIKKQKKGRKPQNAFPSMVVARSKLDAKRNSISHRETKSHPALKRSVSAPSKVPPTSKVPTTLLGKIIPIQAPMIWKLVNSSQEKSAPVDLAKIQNMKSNATLKFTGEQKVLIRFSQNNNNSSSTAVKTIIANVASSSKSPPKNSTGVKMRQAVLMPISTVNEVNSGIKTDSCSGMSIVNRPVRLLRSTAKVTPHMQNYSIIPLSSLISSSSTVSSVPHLFSTVQKNAVRTNLASTAQQLLAVPPKSNTSCIASVHQNIVNATAATIMSATAAATTKLTSAASAVKLIVVSSISSSFQNTSPIIVPATHNIQTAFSGSINAISSSLHATPTLTSSTSASTKQAFLPQTSKTLIIKHSASTPQVFTLIPASGHQSSGQLQLISPSQVIQRPQACTPLAARGTQQLIRPIFIAAQPSLQAPRSTGVIGKIISSTPTVTTQAIFIATAPVNHNGQQPTSTIKLALSPSKSIFAGAIPLIFSPQAPVSSASSFSNQLQNALSSLQSQNLATMPIISSQTPIVSVVQTTPHPVSEKQILSAEVAPNANTIHTPNSSAAVVATKGKLLANLPENPGVEQSGPEEENSISRRILIPRESASSKESVELVSVESQAAEFDETHDNNSEKETSSTLGLGDELSASGSKVPLSDIASLTGSTAGVDKGAATVDSPIGELPSLKHALPSVVEERVCEQTEVAAPSEILKYLPTLPGACTTAVAKSREKLSIKIPLSKLIRNTRSAYHAESIPAISRKDHSPISDLADISQIIKHTANIDLGLCHSDVEHTQQQVVSSTSVLSDCNPSVPNSIVSMAQSSQLSSPVKSAMQRFVEIRPATTHSFMVPSVTPIFVSAPTVINTTSLRTPIVTPAVSNSAVEESGKSSESLPISIKLVSVDSGVRLRNSKLISTVPISSQTLMGAKHLPTQSVQTPLLPRPTQGYLTVLTRKPQLSNVASNQIQRFPVTYLTSLPLQMNNQPRPQVVIQPAPRAYLSGPLQPASQNVSTNNVRFGNQPMVIPVTLSLPGVNLQQVPVTSNILLPSLYPISSNAGLKQMPQTQVRNVINASLVQSAASQCITPASKVQRLAPHPVTSIVAKQAVISELTKPFTSMQGNLVTVSGGFPAQTSQDANTLKLPTASQDKLYASVEKTLSSATITKPAPTLPIATNAMVTALSSLPLTAVSSCLAPQCEANAIKENGLNYGSNSPSRDGIVGLTNSLKTLLKTDITEDSTVTINIQGNPVTYALKDGKLFSMPHDFPAKKEKSSVASGTKSNTSPMQDSDLLPASSISSTPLVTDSCSTGLDVTLRVVSSHDHPVSRTTAPYIESSSRENEPLSSSKHLRVSVPKRLLHRKTFRSKSADISNHAARQLSKTQETTTIPTVPSMSPVVPVTATVTIATSIFVSAVSSSIMSSCLASNEVVSSVTNLHSSCRLPNTIPSEPSSTTPISSTSNLHSSCSTHQSIITNGKPVATCLSDTYSKIGQPHTTQVGPHTTNVGARTMHTPLHTAHSFNFSENKTQRDDDNSLKRSNSEPVDLKFGFECDFCSDKFESYNLMWRHRKLHLNDTVNFSGLRQPPVPHALCPKFIVCDQCSKVFQSNSDLQRHKQQENCTTNTVFRCRGGSHEADPNTRFVNGRQAWDASHTDDMNGIDLTFDLLTDDSSDMFQGEISPNIACDVSEGKTTASFSAFTGDSCVPSFRNTAPAMSDCFYDIAPNLIESVRPCSDKDAINGSEVVSNRKSENFDINANFDDQVFEDFEDVKPDIKPAKIRRTSGRQSIPRKRIVSRKNSHIAKSNANQKRIKRRSRVTISDDEEAIGDDSLDLDGEFVTVGKLHGEFTCSRCDLGFQNEDELDDHNESFHDSLRYNFRERRSVSNLDYLDELEFDFD